MTELKNLSHYKTGGKVRDFYAPNSDLELQSCLSRVQKMKVPLFILGGGSNSLVMDEYWDGAVISLHNLRRLTLQPDGTQVVAAAGVHNSELAEFAKEHSLSRAEWMYGLPGQVGGSVRMNARCYGGEMSQIVTAVKCYDLFGVEHSFSHLQSSNEVFRGYKNTLFMDKPLIIAQVSFSLVSGEKDQISRKMLDCFNDRKGKDQFLYPSCGCVFKNDYSPEVSVPSGMLLESVGLLGHQAKNASISHKHANFVFNQGASSREIIELTLHMRECVWKTFGVWLDYELEFLGQVPEDLQKRVFEKRAPQYRSEKLAKLRKSFASRTKKVGA